MNGRHGAAAPRPRTQAEHVAELARVAWVRGHDARAAGDLAAARAWLERARRLVPEDAMVALLLAMTLLDLGEPAAAADLFEPVAERHGVPEAWLGLTTARWRQGSVSAAASALAALLSRFALPAGGVTGLADAIAAASGQSGWCGLRSDGVLVVGPAAGPPPTVALDGAPTRSDIASVPACVANVSVNRAGRPLLGSPIDVAAIRRVEGFVAARPDGGLEGWAWHPGDPASDPELWIEPLSGGGSERLVAREPEPSPPRPLSRPRRFVLPAEPARLSGPLRLTGADGRDLTGSPIDPGAPLRGAAEAAALLARAWPALPAAQPPVPSPPLAAVPADIAGWPAHAPLRRRRRVAVVVPVYRGVRPTLDCLEAVYATLPAGGSLVVVDDASPEPALVAALDDLARRRRIRLLRQAHNGGFPAAANVGLRAAAALPGGPDVVLLNSDTVPAPGWIEGLRAVVHAAADIGTATPLSNDGSIVSYPDPRPPMPRPAPARSAALAALAARANADVAVDIPTAIGFCMYIRRECLLATGVFREDLFAQGYGEENDFCLRARHLGWRHVAAPGVYVAHLGGASFGDARAQLLRRNTEVLNRLHPGYDALIAAWQERDPLAQARRRLGALRWAEARRPESRAAILVSHDSGGGVERVLRERCAALRGEGLRPVVLRPVIDRSLRPEAAERRYLPGLCEVSEGLEHGFPELRFRLPDELPLLAELLLRDRPQGMEVHHLLGHHHSVLDLARMLRVSYQIAVHDYAWFCPRISLLAPSNRYCGEPDVTACAACVADGGSQLEEDIAPAALRLRSASDLAGARRVVAPSDDAARRMQRHFPDAAIAVVPHQPPRADPLLAPPPGRRRVCVVGAIGYEKGYEVLLAAARDAAARGLPLDFVLVGYSIDDDRLQATGRVFVTGPYREGEATALIRAQAAHLAWLPSIWPETWCYALSEAWRAGLRVVAFDIGAQAERIRREDGGWLLPLGLPAPRVNNALLAVNAPRADEYATPTGVVQM